MKKLRLLLILPLLFVCTNVVKSAEMSNTDVKTVTISTKHIRMDITGVHNGYMYYINLDGGIAFCMNPGKTLRNGALYRMAYSIPSSANSSVTPIEHVQMQAYFYGKNNAGDDIARVISQTIVWVKSTDKNVLYQSALEATQAYSKVYGNSGVSREEDIKRHVDALLSTSVPSGTVLYVWEHVGNPDTWQRLLSDAKGTESPDKDAPCKVVNQNELPICSGTGRYNYGTIYQYATGMCYNGYVKKENNTTSRVGQKERDYGSYCRMYCLKTFTETLPGNISKAVSVGQYIVWPNNNVTNNNYKINANLATYPMITTLEKKCKISVDNTALSTDYNKAKKIMSDNRVTGEADYINHGYSCAWLEQEKIKKENEYNEAKSRYEEQYRSYQSCLGAYGSCMTSSQGKGPCSGCGSAPSRAGVDAAQKELDRVTKQLEKCNNYKKGYESAKRIIKDFNNCISADASMTLNYTLNGVRSEYNDPEYKGSFDLTENSASSTCDGCKSNVTKLSEDPRNVSANDVTSRKNQIEQRKIVATLTKKYDMAEYNGTYYYYVNKDNLKFLNSNAGLTNYTTVGFSNMPISYKADSKTTYNLDIKINDVSGDASVFSSEISSNQYVCSYKVKRTSDSCVCPEGTMHAGESLTTIIKNNNETCSDAQDKYCDDPTPIPHEPSDLTCPDDPSMDLSGCVNAGMTYDECASKFCTGNKWVCPAGTNEGMDLTSCVLPMMVKGYSEAEAYEYCKDVTCPYGGIKIIYRVIDLTNPFPSKDADATVTQSNLRVGMFNDELKGRYPGSNWNSTRVVRAKILNNRNVDGDQVYNKTPMYTFIVNSQNIKAIRNYNKAQHNSYSDFKLKCLINDSAACKSEFVHDATYGLVSGTCKNVSKGNFYTCDD